MLVLHDAERDMHHHQPIGDIDRHVQRLPDARREERQPEVVAGRGHQEQDQQRGDAERLEREADELAVVLPGRQLGDEVRQIALHQIPVEQEPEMRDRDQKRQHAEMPAVVEQRQEAAVEPRQRADRQDHGEHQEGAGAEGANPDVDRVRQILRRMPLPIDRGKAGDEERDGGEQHAVIDELVPVPLHRAEADAHAFVAS